MKKGLGIDIVFFEVEVVKCIVETRVAGDVVVGVHGVDVVDGGVFGGLHCAGDRTVVGL